MIFFLLGFETSLGKDLGYRLEGENEEGENCRTRERISKRHFEDAAQRVEKGKPQGLEHAGNEELASRILLIELFHI